MCVCIQQPGRFHSSWESTQECFFPPLTLPAVSSIATDSLPTHKHRDTPWLADVGCSGLNGHCMVGVGAVSVTIVCDTKSSMCLQVLVFSPTWFPDLEDNGTLAA